MTIFLFVPSAIIASNLFHTHAASLSFASLSELFAKLFALRLFPHFGKTVGNLCLEIFWEGIFQWWKTGWKFCFPFTTNFHSGQGVMSSSPKLMQIHFFPSTSAVVFLHSKGKVGNKKNSSVVIRKKRVKIKNYSPTRKRGKIQVWKALKEIK